VSAPFSHKDGPYEELCERMDKTGRKFEYVRNKFPNMSDAIIKEGIFIGPQIRFKKNSSMKT
jgi:hypothetical protein